MRMKRLHLESPDSPPMKRNRTICISDLKRRYRRESLVLILGRSEDIRPKVVMTVDGMALNIVASQKK
jgi:hypothetical protein